MRIQDALDRATSTVRRVKAEHVRRVKGKPDRTDIDTVVEVYRGDVPVATVFLRPDRDAMLEACSLAATGFDADVLAVTMETWMGKGKAELLEEVLHPLTGARLQQGDLEDLVLNHDGLAQGWVVAAVCTQVVNRAGDSAVSIQPYRIEGRAVEWLEGGPTEFSNQEEAPARFEGIVPEALAELMNRPSMDQLLAQDGVSLPELGSMMGLSPEQVRAHVDAAALKSMTLRLGPVLVGFMLTAQPGSVRDQVLRQSLSRASIQRPPV